MTEEENQPQDDSAEGALDRFEGINTTSEEEMEVLKTMHGCFSILTPPSQIQAITAEMISFAANSKIPMDTPLVVQTQMKETTCLVILSYEQDGQKSEVQEALRHLVDLAGKLGKVACLSMVGIEGFDDIETPEHDEKNDEDRKESDQ